MTALRVEHRGKVQRWAVVHMATGKAALILLPSRKAALEAMRRVEAMPIRWDSATSTTHRGASGEEYVATTLDAESMRLLSDEQLRICRR